MRSSADRILTSHVGSLPRPEALIDANRARDAGDSKDEAAFQQTLRTAVADVVRHQKELGIDVRRPGPPADRLGQVGDAGAGRGARQPAIVALSGICGHR
jgi:5-methyltetrahydropteroyltriglutamate--homocysteine methyltransferase